MPNEKEIYPQQEEESMMFILFYQNFLQTILNMAAAISTSCVCVYTISYSPPTDGRRNSQLNSRISGAAPLVMAKVFGGVAGYGDFLLGSRKLWRCMPISSLARGNRSNGPLLEDDLVFRRSHGYQDDDLHVVAGHGKPEPCVISQFP